MIVQKLDTMNIDSDADESKVYRYKFNFRAE